MSPLAEGSSHEEEPEPDAPAGPPEAVETPEEPRRHPSTIGGALYLVILAVVVVSLAVAAAGRWQLGTHGVAGCLLVAAVLRFALPDRDAGMLAVRGRWLDGGLLAVLGAALWFLASTMPDAS